MPDELDTCEWHFSGKNMPLLVILTAQIGVATDTYGMLLTRSRLWETDDLPRLCSSHHFGEVLELEIRHSERDHCPLCLAMLDVVGFKNCHDRFGPIRSDAVLSTFVRTLQLGLRNHDVACRYGRDEIAVILPETRIQNAAKIVDGVRTMFLSTPEAQTVLMQGCLGLSAGIAEFPQAATTPNGLLFMADSARRYARKLGLNKSVLVCNFAHCSTTIWTR